MQRLILLLTIILCIQFSLIAQTKVDLLLFNGTIYIVDSTMSTAEAMVVNQGKVLETGTNQNIKQKYSATEIIDLHGKPVYPGFIDAHCHFYGYGLDLQYADLKDTKSWDEVVARVSEHAKKHPTSWILGRGWDQNTWPVKEFPNRKMLDSLFPDRPVFLQRIDGHAAIVNDVALKLAKMNEQTIISGGIIEKKKINGKDWLTGTLVDNAVDSVKVKIPPPSREEQIAALMEAQQNCFAVGLTTVDDAGLKRKTLELIDSLQASPDIKNPLMMRIYGMVTSDDEDIEYYLKRGIYRTEKLNIHSIKFYADGALGSRGACLLKPYSDKPEQQGFLLHPEDYFKKMAKRISNSEFQMNTHCIGDSAVRFILHTYSEALKNQKDRRWRIEHAQVVSPEDFALFKKYRIIPSVQPTHATSDMYWAADRLGPERVKGAYAYHQLLEQNGMIPSGSDFPVEDINPLYGFYAAVVRQDKTGFPENGFQIENKWSRAEALKAMTIWAAYSNFEEKEKGSLEPGKFADFVILESDIMKIPDDMLFSVRVVRTYVGGVKVYQKR